MNMLLRLCYGFCWIICFRAAQAFYNLNMNQFATVSRTLLKSTASFTTCRNCHKKYFVDMEEFSNIRYMRCSFCDRKWYQDPEGLLKFSERNELLEGDQYPPIVPLFVMGFPNTFSSDDLVDLFAEYGVVSIRMLPNKRTLKNYAVIAIAGEEAGERAINEMNGFYVAKNTYIRVEKQRIQDRTKQSSSND